MFQGLDLAVFPSLVPESYSMVLDEAVALGLPVVVSDAGALPERVGKGGMICAAGDARALAEALVTLERDRSRLENLSRAIQEMFWSIEDNRRTLDVIYEEVLREGAKRTPYRAQLRRTALLKGRTARLERKLEEREGASLRFSRFREFVPLLDWSGLPGGGILILAPHPDDEVIGCGGVTALHAGRGDRVTVVHLTDGAGGGAGSREGGGLAEVRKREAERAGAILGTDEFIRLERPDGKLLPDPETVEMVLEVIKARNPSVLYVPSPFEIHPDHVAALFIALHLLDRYEGGFKLLLYEVNEAMVPGFLVDITRVLEKKDRALACFESQIRLNDVRDKSIAGARWRTANVDLPRVTHCEAFIEAGPRNLKGLMARTKELVRFIGKGGTGDV